MDRWLYLAPLIAMLLISAVMAIILPPKARRLHIVGETPETRQKRLKDQNLGLGLALSFSIGLGAWMSYWMYFSDQVNAETLTLSGQSSMEESFKLNGWILKFIGPATLTTGRESGGVTVVERANLYRAINDLDRAMNAYWGLMGRLYPRSLDGVRRLAADKSLPEVNCVANAFAGIGKIYALTHRPQEAEMTFKRAIQLYRELERPDLVAVTENNLAVVYYMQHKNNDARWLSKKAIADLPMADRNDKNQIYIRLIANAKQLTAKSNETSKAALAKPTL